MDKNTFKSHWQDVISKGVVGIYQGVKIYVLPDGLTYVADGNEFSSVEDAKGYIDSIMRDVVVRNRSDEAQKATFFKATVVVTWVNQGGQMEQSYIHTIAYDIGAAESQAENELYRMYGDDVARISSVKVVDMTQKAERDMTTENYQLTEKEMGGIDAALKAGENNPWAICHAQGLTGDKFERCVLHVKEQLGKGGDAGTATQARDAAGNLLGPQAAKTVDTGYAGNVPASLLARQDLEGGRRPKTQKSHSDEKIPAMIQDEIEGEKGYRNAAEATSDRDNAAAFNDMANDEAKHQQMLLALRKSIARKGRLAFKVSLGGFNLTALANEVFDKYLDWDGTGWAMAAKAYLRQKGVPEDVSDEVVAMVSEAYRAEQ